MRRFAAVLTVAAMMIPAVTAVAGDYGEYRDDFKDVSYSGNDGSLDWIGPWYDSEDQNPATGVIHVDDGICEGNKCLHIDSAEGIEIDAYVKRKADMSVFSNSELCFEMFIDNENQVDVATLTVDISSDGGSKWHNLATYPVLTAGGYHKVIKDLSDFKSPNTYLRFRITGVLNSAIYIDNVEIKGEFGQTTSTTSTSTTSSTSSTSSTSTTSTTSPTTTSSTAATTTTTRATTTTSQDDSASTSRPSESTTTTVAESTTTTAPAFGPIPGEPPTDSGLRDPGQGLLADYGDGMMGDMDMEDVEVLGAEVTADFSMAVEVFESAKVWVAVLALMITAAIVSGMDTRRARRLGR